MRVTHTEGKTWEKTAVEVDMITLADSFKPLSRLTVGNKNSFGLVVLSLVLLSEYHHVFAQIDSPQQVYRLCTRTGYCYKSDSDGTLIETRQQQTECTIGVAAGNATSDGRPLLWKTRDYSSEPDNEVYYNTSFQHKFISVVNAGETYAWMGVNEEGFSILNSLSTDLPAGSTGPGNGELMRLALGTCKTVADFEHLLDSTNVTGRQTQANFGVIDTTGAAAIFETSGSQYWKFDANNTSQAPDGYVLRTNFAINGGGSSGIERYNRTVALIGEFYTGDSLNYKSILRSQMRDFSDFESNPVPVPYPQQWSPDRPFGYIYAGVSICRSSSVSASVIQGVLPDESAKLTTMWTMLGQPASTIMVPYWPVGDTPEEADGALTSPLCDAANQIKSLLFDYAPNANYIDSYKLRDEEGDGLWSQTFPAEDIIFTAAEANLAQWRSGTFSVEEMLTAEILYAKYALSVLQQAYNQLVGETTVKVETKVFLEGSYNAVSNEMSALLRAGDFIPNTSPYNDDPRTVLVIPENVVDWVLVELRETPTDDAVTFKSAFLHKDGRIVADDGTTGQISLDITNGDYFIVVKHRNHLAVMSANAQALNGSTSTLFDFTTGTDKYYGSDAALLEAGVYGMYTGDANSNGQVQNDDKNDFWKVQVGTAGYKSADFNLNGEVQNDDKNDYWKSNVGKGTQVP